MPKRPGTKTALPPTEREDLFYEFLAGEARSSLLQSALPVGLPALLADQGPMTEQDIVGALALHPHRGRKWLLLLQYVNLIEAVGTRRGAKPRYANSPLVEVLFERDSLGGFFCRDFCAIGTAAPRTTWWRCCGGRRSQSRGPTRPGRWRTPNCSTTG